MNIRESISTFRGHRIPNIDFMRRKRAWFALSGFFIVLSLVGLIARGLNFSIDFKGGSLLQFPDRSGASVADFEGIMHRFSVNDAQVEILGAGTVNIKTRKSLSDLGINAAATPTPTPSASASASPSASASSSPSPATSPSASAAAGAATSPSVSPTASASASPTASPSPTTGSAGLPTLQGDRLIRALAAKAGISTNEINGDEVGPTWGRTISKKALIGLIIFLLLVTGYITLRFELKMAIGALVAMGHDLVITAGIYALVGREVTPETVIAILTILGYSLYDTVVIFDKVKENTESIALVQRDTYSGVVNMSLNQTLMRSVNTSLVVLLPIGSLLLFGGTTLKDFAFALFVGVASGTYSSIFVAAPILAVLKESEPRYQQIRARAEARATRPSLRQVPGRAGVAAADGDEGRERAALAAVPGGRQGSSTGSQVVRTRSSSGRKKKGKAQGKPKPRRR
jgi:preprotein translocase subunit SecF